MSAASLAVVSALWGFLAAVGVFVFLGRRIAKLKRHIDAISQRLEAIESGESLKPESDHSGIGHPKTVLRESSRLVELPERSSRRPQSVGLGDIRKDVTLSVTRAVNEFNALAAQFGQSELDAFARRWGALPVARTSDAQLIEDTSGEFWLIPLGGERPGALNALVVPGPDIVRKWDLYYRAMGSLAAKNLFESIYEVSEGAPLRIERGALAVGAGRGWRVDDVGKFAER